MSSAEHESMPGNLADTSEEIIPDEIKPMIEKIDRQIESIVKGFNQVFIDNGVPEATIGDFQYVIEISIPSKDNRNSDSNVDRDTTLAVRESELRVRKIRKLVKICILDGHRIPCKN